MIVPGTEWTGVGCECMLETVSVGTYSVWAVDRDHKVWFRIGIDGFISGESPESAQGSGWVEMVGLMSVVAVGMNDQVIFLSDFGKCALIDKFWFLLVPFSKVFAIGHQDREIYFRTGVSFNEPSGRTWKQLTVPVHNSSVSNSDSEVSLTSMRYRRKSLQLGRHSKSDLSNERAPADAETVASQESKECCIVALAPARANSKLDNSSLRVDEEVSARSRASTGSSNITDTVVDFVNDISDSEPSPVHSLEPFAYTRQSSATNGEYFRLIVDLFV